MGQSSLQQTIKLTMMKLLFIVALAVAAVAAEPEAKSDPWYGHYLGKRSADAEPEAYTIPTYYKTTYDTTTYADDTTADATTYTYDTTDDTTTTSPYQYLGKRSADAEPKPEAEAESWYGYGGHYGYGGYPYRYGYGYYRGKRSADAEAAPEAKPWYGYRGYYGYGHPYRYGYGYGYYG